jgi:hypothetical protein
MEDLEQADKDKYEVVAFTHLDNDHVCGAPSFFYLEHAEKYKVEGKPKIDELWVPAAALVEEGLDDDARVIRSEARHRFKQKKGIRVFSRPDRLKEWMKKEKLDFDAHKHLITDAGQLVPGWSKDKVSHRWCGHLCVPPPSRLGCRRAGFADPLAIRPDRCERSLLPRKQQLRSQHTWIILRSHAWWRE